MNATWPSTRTLFLALAMVIAAVWPTTIAHGQFRAQDGSASQDEQQPLPWVDESIQPSDREPAHQQFIFAYRLLQQGEDKLAAEAFDEYLDRFPNDEKQGDGRYYRALLARREKDNLRALTLLSGNTPTRVVPDYAVNLLRGQVYCDADDYDKAINSLEKINSDRLDPLIKASVLYLKGLAYRGAQNLGASASSLSTVAQMDTPLRGRALLDLARVQVLMNQPDQAIASLQQCVQLGHDVITAEAARLAGDLCYNHGKFPQAIRSYSTVVTAHQSSPHFSPSVLGLLWSQLQAGQYEYLITTFDQFKNTLGVDDRVLAWYLAGSARQELGQHARAIGLFNAIRTGAAGSAVEDKVLYKLALSYYELERFDQTSQLLDEITQKYPDSAIGTDVQLLRAATEARLGDAAGAINRLTVIVNKGEEHPHHGLALLQRAKIYELHDQPEAALEDYQRYLDFAAGRSVQDAPMASQRQAVIRMVNLNHRLGNFKEAVQLAEQLLAPSHIAPAIEQEALYRLGLALIQLDQLEEALETMDRLAAIPASEQKYAIESRYYRGLLMMSLDRPDEAIEHLKAVTDAPTQVNVPVELQVNALRLMIVRLKETHDKNGTAHALLELEKLLDTAAMDVHEVIWLSRYLVEHDRSKEALGRLDQIVNLRPDLKPVDRSEAMFLQGCAYRGLGDLPQAQELFRHVVALGAGFELEARLEIARVNADDGRLDQALEEYEGLITAERPEIAVRALYDSAGLHLQRASVMETAGDESGAAVAKRQARKLFKRIVLLYPLARLAPLPQLSYLELGRLAAEAHHIDQAISEYEDLTSKFPDSPYAEYGKAMVAYHQKRISDAQFLLNRLRDLPLAPPLAARVEAQLQKVKGIQ